MSESVGTVFIQAKNENGTYIGSREALLKFVESLLSVDFTGAAIASINASVEFLPLKDTDSNTESTNIGIDTFELERFHNFSNVEDRKLRELLQLIDEYAQYGWTRSKTVIPTILAKLIDVYGKDRICRILEMDESESLINAQLNAYDISDIFEDLGIRYKIRRTGKSICVTPMYKTAKLLR